MIVKIFANKGGGSAGASIDYLLGKDRQREGAKVLSGDPELSKTIAESLEFKNRYTVGCLSFEERKISPKAKQEIMEKFEKTIFSGMEKDQYNITWIEHSDKNRVELNFFIPNVELRTDKRLQPYYDKADRVLTDNFQTVINKEYGLSDPHAFEKKQLLKIDLDTPKPIAEFKKDVHELILNRVAKGEIHSQENLVDVFTKAGLEVTRATGKSISIKNPDGGRNIRFDGELYGKEFYEQTRTIEEFREYVGREQGGKLKENRENEQRTYERACSELGKAVERRTERHQELYPKQSRIERDIHNDNSRHVRGLGNYFVEDQGRESQSDDVGTSTSELQLIRAFYSARADRSLIPDRREPSSLHSDKREERTSVQEQQLHSNNQSNQIGVFLNELSRRAKASISSAGERIKAFTERFIDIREFIDKRESRNIDFNERKREIARASEEIQRHERTSTKEQQLIDSADREFNEIRISFKDCYEQTKRTDRELGITSEEISKKIIQNEKKELDQDWDMSR